MVKKYASYLIFLLAFVICFNNSFAANQLFIENKGQWPEQVAFKADIQSGSLFIEKSGFTYFFMRGPKHAHDNSMEADNHADEESLYKYSRIKTKFLGASQNVLFKAEKPSITDYNYYLGNDPKHWASAAKAYQTITYNQIYKGIDLKMYESEGSYKYDYIIAPYADVNQIKTEYQYHTSLSLSDGHLIVKHALGDLIEMKPYAYQLIDGEKIEVKANYYIEKNVVSFEFPNGYNFNYELIIDPELVFSTYSGNTSDNFGMSSTYDQYGNAYAGGIVYGQGYPIDSIFVDSTFNGGRIDVSISKFSSDGSQLLYSTFFGGSQVEFIHSMIVNSNDELIFFGTTSSNNIPTVNAIDGTFNGGSSVNAIGQQFTNGTDIYIATINANGNALLNSTYIGGSSNDGLNLINNTNGFAYTNGILYNYGDQARGEINLDQSDNVYLVSSTYSTDFPTVGSGIDTYSGEQDVVVMKFTPNLSAITWSSFLGGSLNEAGYSIKVSKNNYVYVTGGTKSTNYPTTSTALYPSYRGGVSDGFITKIDPSGSSIVASTFLGSNAYDQTYFVEIDRFDGIYAFGQSLGGNFPVNQVAYSNPGAGQYIIKLDSNLSTNIFSTVVGNQAGTGLLDFAPTAFLVDRCQNIYLSGWGGVLGSGLGGSSTQQLNAQMPLTSDAIKNTTHGFNFYLMVLARNADSLVFGTFFGGTSPSTEHVDGGTSRFDKNGVIYQSVCADCRIPNRFPLKNALYPTKPGNACSNAIFKLSLEILPTAKIEATTDSACAPTTIVYENNSVNSNYFLWDFGNGVLDSTNKSIIKTYNLPGLYTVKLIAGDTICGTADTIIKNIHVFNNNLYLKPLSDTVLCAVGPINYKPIYSGTVLDVIWSEDTTFKNRLNQIGIDYLRITPGAPKKYYLKIQGPGCYILDSLTISQVPFGINFSLSDTVGCTPLNVSFTNNSINYDSVYWDFGNNQFSNAINPSFNYTQAGTYPVTLKVYNDQCQRELTLTDTITIYPSIQLEPISDTILCNPNKLFLIANANGTANKFVWSTDSKLLDTVSRNAILNIPTVSKTTTFYLKASNQLCDTIISFTVTVNNLTAELDDEYHQCEGDTLIIEAKNIINSKPYNSIWSASSSGLIGDRTNPSIKVSANNTMQLYFKMTDVFSCVFLDTVDLIVSKPSFSQLFPFTISDSVPIGKRILLISDQQSPYFTYLWQPSDLMETPNAPQTFTNIQSDTIYKLSIFDDSTGCTYRGSLRVDVYDDLCREPNIFIPSAFTPNGDLNNDVLYVRGELIESAHFQIFNRWGELIFESNDLTIGWDGTYQGENAPAAVYVYQLKAKCWSGEEYLAKGDVTLIR